jgi:sulfotransferase family protein
MAEQGDLRPILVRLLEGRVGSTLVMQLLGTSDDVQFDRVYPYENSYLTYFTRLVGQISAARAPDATMIEFLYGDPTRVGPLPFAPEHLSRDDLARESLRSVWQAFSNTLRATTSAGASWYAEKYWGDVTPVIAAGLDPVVIDLVRDPRDIVASVRAFNARTGRELFGRSRARDDRAHLRRMVAGMGFRLQEFGAPLPVTHVVLRYEDLVRDLTGQASKLEAALGVRLSVGVVAEGRSEMDHHMTSPSAESSVGRWMRDLSSADVEAIERALGDAMTARGYSLSSAQPG